MILPKPFVIASLSVTCALLRSTHAEVVISEFLASSSGISILDEDLDDSDWIELHNTGNSSVSLLGYSLTDDDSDATQWVFPDVNLEADGYLIVFASSKNRQVAGSELHTNFRLSAGGEYLALLSPTGDILTEFAPAYPEQEEDISYGIGPDGVTLGFFTTPTPGSVNTVSVNGQVADTQFSVQRGFFDSPFSLEITTETPESEIRYTLNGATPTATTGFVYTAPLNISETTVIRAAAFKDGFFPTNVDTQSYLFLSDVRTQLADRSAPAGWPTGPVNGQVYDYGMDPRISNEGNAQEMIDALAAIPSVILTSDIENFTSAQDGINSNANTRGLEQPGHIEIIGGPDNLDISARCGLRIRGGASRRASNPKHAFRTFFRSQYGDSSLEFPIFGTEGVDEFQRIDFRTAQNYSWSLEGDTNQNTFIREVLARDIQAASGEPYTRSRYYHLYLNGIYWGLYMSQERAQADWGSSYLGGDDDEFDALKSSGAASPDGSGRAATRYDSEATDLHVEPAIPFQGDDVLGEDWRRLWELMQEQTQPGNATTARYLEMQGLNPDGTRNPDYPVLLDVDNLIHYMLVLGFSGSYDSSLSAFIGAANNWNSVRNTVDDDRGFVHLIHDAEHSLGAQNQGRWDNNNDRINTTNGLGSTNGLPNIDNFAMSNPQFFHIQLAASTPEYRERMATLAQAALFNGGYLSQERVMELFEARRQIVDSVIIAESARWGDSHSSRVNDPATKEDWEGATESLRSLLETRGEVFLGHLRLGNLYPDLAAPIYNPVDRFISIGGSITFNPSTEGTIYYTNDGSDPRLSDGTINPTAFLFDSTSSNLIAFGRNSSWSFLDTGVNLGESSITVGNSNYDVTNWKHPDFNDSAWNSGSGVFGYGTLGNANDGGSNIETPMGEATGPGGANPITSYLRRTFTVNEASSVSTITGDLLADDGVIIYLNGIEVFRKNMPNGPANFETFASTAVGGNAESSYNSFTLSPTDLVDGENTIAVELHQASTSSSDLGFDLELSLLNSSGDTVTINRPQTLNARTFSNGEWSALSTNYYTTAVGPEIGDLLISEINYHPVNPSSAAELAVSDDDDDFEFVEIINIASHDLELQGVSLSEQVVGNELEGVRFVFTDGQIIEPGERLIVVSNREAFLTRHPDSAQSIVGEFAEGLANSGESLRLLNEEGDILSSFRYDDTAPWPTEADGEGFSIQLAQIRNDADFNDPFSWIAITSNGSPGAFGPGPFVGVLDGDLDNDGSSDLFEYFSGTDDLDSSSRPEIAFELTTMETESGVSYTFTRDPEAFGFDAEIQRSSDLSFWDVPGTGNELILREILPNGLLRETFFIESEPSATVEFFRIRLRETTP